MKIFFRNIHLYLSLVSGLIIAVVCLTGGVLVFEKELEQAWHPERYHVTSANSPRLPLQQLTGAVAAYKPGAKITGVKVYADPSRTVEFSLAGAPGGEKGDKKEGGRASQGPEARETPAAGNGVPRAEAGRREGGAEGKGEKGGKGGKGGEGGPGGPKVFVNPYTGAVTGELNYRETIFFTMMALHRGMVGGPIGKLIVGISTVMFLFIIATGLVLWWPATRKALQQRLKVKWSGGWKRVNHDLHIVLGFYSALFLFVFAFTGLAWSFEWFNKGIYAVTNSPMQRPEPPASTVPAAATVAAAPVQAVQGLPVASAAPLSPDAALQLVKQQVPEAESYALQLPKDLAGSIRVATLRRGASYENATDELFLDQYSGKVLSQQTYEQRSLGQRVRGMFKPVHTGAVFGWPSKIIALVVCLLGFTFPITGTILWLNRLRKANKKQRKQQNTVAAM
ncbi:PepSY domain-containing protein [Hymenobacter taeanensis]|uniref:PepSY domain-containing protein n=1 Tax=Hymenobacter taeanensis TaxID=2735321 RepID=A0A6M6BLV2_9BACT|nr:MULTISPECIES: PepSY-associated TM helix domain-containing protein [Hymenobacter]QJX48957.1 PepSY domain-containing protein [Hymenobacter taeanensis]UOQ81528.1 PepSY domain-containing protein [Hymenobacter sp. 5414T-23]